MLPVRAPAFLSLGTGGLGCHRWKILAILLSKCIHFRDKVGPGSDPALSRAETGNPARRKLRPDV